MSEAGSALCPAFCVTFVKSQRDIEAGSKRKSVVKKVVTLSRHTAYIKDWCGFSG